MHTIEDFEKGDVVFWAAKSATSKWRVKFGVIDFLSDCGAIIDLLSVREHRFVNGVPINEFKSETKFKKLPKGWSWNTELFEMTYEEIEVPEELNDLRKVNNIEALLAMGYLVPMKEVFDGVIEAEITKEGYRIIKNYPMWRRQEPRKRKPKKVVLDKSSCMYKKNGKCANRSCINYEYECLRPRYCIKQRPIKEVVE